MHSWRNAKSSKHISAILISDIPLIDRLVVHEHIIVISYITLHYINSPILTSAYGVQLYYDNISWIQYFMEIFAKCFHKAMDFNLICLHRGTVLTMQLTCFTIWNCSYPATTITHTSKTFPRNLVMINRNFCVDPFVRTVYAHISAYERLINEAPDSLDWLEFLVFNEILAFHYWWPLAVA